MLFRSFSAAPHWHSHFELGQPGSSLGTGGERILSEMRSARDSRMTALGVRDHGCNGKSPVHTVHRESLRMLRVLLAGD
jgi:hypothetical protein